MLMRISVMRAAILVLALAMLTSSSAAAAHKAPSSGASAFVRVNQVGYPTGASKRAYLMASAVETGATFAVKNSSGATVLSGPIGARLGSWSTGYPNVYAIDFDQPRHGRQLHDLRRRPDRRRLTAPSWSAPARPSTPVPCETRCPSTRTSATVPDFIPSALRTAPGHLNDENAMTYLDAERQRRNGNFKGDLTPLGIRSTAPAAGGTPATT